MHRPEGRLRRVPAVLAAAAPGLVLSLLGLFHPTQLTPGTAGRDHLLAVEVDVRGRWSYTAWITRKLSRAAGASIQKRLPARTCR